MAPKRSTTNKRQRSDSHDTTRFASLEAAKKYKAICKQPIVPERGLVNEPPFSDTVAKLKWDNFIKTPQHGGGQELTLEFYANLAAHPMNKVFLRGKHIDISARAINRFYGLPEYELDEYMQTNNAIIDMINFMTILTGSPAEPPVAWTYLKKAQLTREAKTMYYFVASRLLPTVVNSQVQKNRAFMTYALLKGLTVDVGRIIHDEMLTIVDGVSWHSMGFPALIHGLACAQGVSGPILTDGPIRTKQPISLKLIDQGFRWQQKNAPLEESNSDDEEEQADGESSQTELRLATIEGHITEMRSEIAGIHANVATLHTFVEEQFAVVLARLPPPTLE